MVFWESSGESLGIPLEGSKVSKCESWCTKREGLLVDRVGAFWERFMGFGKHMRGRVLCEMGNTGECKH